MLYCILSPGILNTPIRRSLQNRVGAFLRCFVKAPKDMLSLAPLLQESLFHRSIMDLGFCNVILVKEQNTR